jgi:hypothetical protein
VKVLSWQKRKRREEEGEENAYHASGKVKN